MNPGDQVFVFPKRDVRQGQWARVLTASEDQSMVCLASLRGEDEFRLMLERDQNPPFWTEMFTRQKYGISISQIEAEP